MFCRYALAGIGSLTVVLGVQLFQHKSNIAALGKTSACLDDAATITDTTAALRSQSLREFQGRRDNFSVFSDRLEEELARGETSLREATERVFYYCLQNYPEHLENVEYAEPGRSIKMKLAHSLLRTFHAPPPDGAQTGVRDARIVTQLDQELLDLPYDGEVSRAVTRQ